MSFFGQVKALVIKDFQISKRNRVGTIAEMIVPIFAGCIAGVLILVLSIISTNGDEWSDTDRIDIESHTRFFRGQPEAAFGRPYLDAVNNQLAGWVNSKTNKTFSFQNVDSAAENLTSSVINASILANNCSYDQINSFGILPVTERGVNYYAITFAAILADSTSLTAGAISTLLGSLFFNENGTKSGQEQIYGSTWYRPMFIDINLRAIFSSSGMLMLLYAFIPSALTNGSRLVTEKKLKVRETLRVMGVSDSAYLTAHFISMFIRMFFGCVLISLILLAFKAIDGDAVVPVLGISILFCFSMICEAQMMPALFSADVWTNVFNIFFITGAASLAQFTTGSAKEVQILVCLLSPGGYYYAVLPYLSKGSIQLNLTSGEAAFIMIIDSIVYFFIANYVYNVFPGEWGVPRHPLYFLDCLCPSSKHGSSSNSHGRKPTQISTGNLNDPSRKSIMSPKEGSPVKTSELRDADEISNNLFVDIKGLVKQFPGNPTPSVNKLDLTIRRGEVFGALGQNGAGKTTLLSMMTGVLDSTSYEYAEIGGYDMRTEMDLIRKDIALCPQFDVLFPELTALQHLQLFASLKGKDPEGPYVHLLMHELSLPVGDDPCKVYSGGTQRRLSVANALVGESRFILLDEPSSSLDPISRRKLWNLIKNEKKKGKTFILCTHYLEEADYLSDRISIMANGKVKVCATSTELKHKYDVGYTITCSKASRDTRTDTILAMITKHVPAATLKLDSDGEVQFLVPTENLTSLVVELEENQGNLQIQSYGIDACTLEDVFVRLATEDDEERKLKKQIEEGKKSSSHGGAAAASSATPTTTSPAVAEGGSVYTPEVEERFESLYSVAKAKPVSSRVWFQAKLTLSRSFTQLSRSMPMKVFALMFPLFLLALGFLTLQPNQTSHQTNFGKTYDWVDFTSNTEDLNLVLVDLHSADADDSQIATNIENFKKEFDTLWRSTMGVTTQTINWYTAKSYTDFATGQYVPLYGFTFTGPKSPAVYGGVIPHAWDLTKKEANYTMLWTQRYDPVLSIPLGACFRAAMDKVVGRVSPTGYLGRGNFTFVPKQIDYQTTVAKIMWMDNCSKNSSSGNNNNNNNGGDSDNNATTYNVMVLGLYFVLSIGQLVAATQRGYADELKRKVYRVLLLNGLHPLAHVVGTFLFSFIVSLWALVILLVGLYFKGIDSDTKGGVMGPILLAAILFIIHTILFCLWITSYFPGKAPSTYTLFVHLYNIVTMGAPYLIDKLFSVGHFTFQPSLRPFLLSFFPSCAFYHVFDVASSVVPAKADASRLFEFGDDDVTESAKTGWAFVLLGVELIIPVILLHNFIYHVGIYAWVMRRREGLGEKDTKYKVSNLKQSMGERQSLLAEHDEDENHNRRASGAGGNRNSAALINGLTIEELEDDDVRAERERTSRAPSHLTFDHLRKTFNNGEKVAVNDLCLGIEQGTCFGLLGPNGAGKSTACSIVVRESNPTSGNVHYLEDAFSVTKTPMLECYSAVRLGVCMQTDTLYEYLTAAEHMEFYLKLRLLDEYKESEWDGFIKACLEAIQLNDVATKEAGGFSGGMKRKLQVCLAMYTGSFVTFLDEPSNGVDTFSRRALWKVIKGALTSKVSVILTTHAMDEASSVCNRIGIMTNGVLRCVNSPMALQQKYGANFVVTTELRNEIDFTDKETLDETVELIRRDLAHMFTNASLIEHVGSLCRFQIGSIPSLAKAFQDLDAKKEAWKIRTYAISQMSSLEQIFVNIVKTGGGNLDEEAM